MLDGIDLTNPCAVWPVLNGALLRLISGEQEVRVRFKEREVEFAPGSIKELRTQIAHLQAECMRAQRKRTRFAIRGTFHPR